MKNSILKFGLFICLSNTSFWVNAQRPLISDYNEVLKRANTEMDSSMQSGFLHDMVVKNKIKGEYVMDVTVHEKGEVLSVYAVTSDAEDVKQQNLVKDILKQMKFNFKMPKGKTYKVEHTFKFQ